MLQKTREIHEVNLSRRLTLRTMNSWNQTEWMGYEKIIKMSSLKAPILIGMFEKIREAGGPRLEPVYVPPSIITSLGSQTVFIGGRDGCYFPALGFQ